MVASRVALALVGLSIALPAMAEDLKPEQARRLVVGKLFSYTCFEGTKGAGRIYADGSVAGTIQMQGSGPVRYAALPADTLQVKGEKICASVKGAMFEPCFNLRQTSSNSFRGSVSGLGFAYCDFTQRGGRGRRDLMRTATGERPRPMNLRSTIAQ